MGKVENATKALVIANGYKRNRYQIDEKELKQVAKLADPHNQPFFKNGKEYWPGRLAHKRNRHFQERTGRRYQNKACPQLGWEILHCAWTDCPFLKGQTDQLPGYLAEDIKKFRPAKKGRGSIPKDKLYRDSEGDWAPVSLASFLTKKTPDEIKQLRKQERISARRIANYTRRGPKHKQIWIYDLGRLRPFARYRQAFDKRLKHLIKLRHFVKVLSDARAARASPRAMIAGRKISKRTAAICKFCCKESEKGIKAALIKVRANGRFGDGAVSDSRYVSIYASRYRKNRYKIERTLQN
jgi:hypothetical protein